MSTVVAAALPATALLQRYAGRGYTDGWVATTPGHCSLSAYVVAFYTTPLFKLERALLAALASRPSTDAQARDLADGRRDTFAAWRVEALASDQLLLAAGRTRSWFMVVPAEMSTTLYFGSAVTPLPPRAGSTAALPPRMGWPFHALQGFHRLYSHALLSAACRRLRRG